MDAERSLRRAGVVLAVAVVLCMAQGCAAVNYVKYRAQDAMEMADVGLTFTLKPCVGLYWNSLDLLVGGYSNIDGYFVGFGGGQVGVTRCYAHCWGLGLSLEKVGWGSFDKNDDKTLHVRVGGAGGLVSLVTGGTPDYTPACVHFFPHIGYVGFVWNARWSQMLDFILGFTTFDLAGDDGSKFGTWFWLKEETSPQGNVPARVTAPYRDAMAGPTHIGPAPGPAPYSNAVAGQAGSAPVTAPYVNAMAGRRQTEPAPQAEPAAVPDGGAAMPPNAPAPLVVPFSLPAVRGPAPVPQKAAAGPGVGQTYTVREGDTLYGIAVRVYGDGKRWMDIQAANPEVSRDEHKLRPGTVLRIP